MKRILSLMIIWSMTAGSSAFGFEADVAASPEKMLSPAIQVNSAVLHEGYLQASDSLKAASAGLEPDQAVKKLLSELPDIAAHPVIVQLQESFEKAFAGYSEGAGYLALVNAGAQSVQYNAKYMANKDVIHVKKDGFAFWQKAIAELGQIDIDAAEKLIPAEKSEIIYQVLALGAEISFSLAEENTALSPEQMLAYYAQCKNLLERAFALPQIEPDFQNIRLLAVAISKVAAGSPVYSSKKRVEMLRESVGYFAKAEALADTLPDTDEAAKNVQEMNYLYFTVLYYLGDLCWEQGDYREGIIEYNKCASLLDKLKKRPEYMSQIKGFYANYNYRLLAFGDLLGKAADKSDESGVLGQARKAIYLQANFAADKYLKMLTENESKGLEAFDALICVIEVNSNLASSAMKEGNLDRAAEHMRLAVDALGRLYEIRTVDYFNNYTVAEKTYSTLWAQLELLQKLVPEKGFAAENVLDKKFFKPFLKRVKAGTYTDLFNALSADPKDKTALNILNKELLRYSKAKLYLVKTLKSAFANLSDEPDRDKRSEFNKLHKFTAYLMLAAAHVYAEEYNQAKEALQSAMQDSEKFAKNTTLKESIFPQIEIDRANGKKFLQDLLSNMRTSFKMINYIADNAEDISAPMRSMLEEILSDEANDRLMSVSKRLIETLGLKIKEKKESKPASGSNGNGNGSKKIKGAIKTTDVLISDFKQSIMDIKTRADTKVKVAGQGKKKKKRNVSQKPEENWPQVRAYSKALDAVIKKFIDSDERQVKTKESLSNLLSKIADDPVIMGYPVLVRVTARQIAAAEDKEVLFALKSIINSRRKSDVAPVRNELENLLAKSLDYHNRMSEFRTAAGSLEKTLKSIDAKDREFRRNQDRISWVEKEFNGFLENYKDLTEEGVKGTALLDEYSKSIRANIALLREQVSGFREAAINAYVNECDNSKEAMEKKWEELNTVLSGAELAVALKKWMMDLKLPSPDKEIISDEAVIAAAADVSAAWQDMQLRIQEKTEQLSLICKKKVKYSIKGEFEKLHFENIDILMGISKEAAIKDIYDVIKAVIEQNPDIDIEADITGREHPNSQGIFPPRLEETKHMAAEEKAALSFVHDCRQFCGRYEQAMRGLLEKGLSRVKLIKEVRDLLGDEFENPDILDRDLDELSEIEQAGLDEFTARTKALYDRQEELQTVCMGMFELSIKGEYEYLFFKPLTEAPNVAAVKQQVEVILKEALSYNQDIQMQIPAEIDEEAEWVRDIAEIWYYEHKAVEQKTKEDQLINGEVKADTAALSDNNSLINSAI